jgi:hypothetical protein
MGPLSGMGLDLDEKNRTLYIILLNSGNAGRKSAAILYIDLARLILKRLGIDHNVEFLLDNRTGQSQEERIKYIDENLEKIRSFNNKTLMQE